MIKENKKEDLENIERLLLDSSLIIATSKTNNHKYYNIKVRLLDEYVQVYFYENGKTKKNVDLEPIGKEQKCKIDNLSKINHSNEKNTYTIDKKNATRSKLKCQALAKCNMKEWKTFITLTIAENIKDINIANKKLHCFTTKVQRVFKDFKYICIPEFQKRGAVHYHMLTNIDINNKDLIYSQKGNPKYKHIKYWLEGYDEVDIIQGDVKKIIGYISKYMTKDIDDRLFNRRRYHFSKNLKMPTETYIDLNTKQGLNYFKKIIQDKHLIYNSQYTNVYDNSKVVFLEYLK